MTTVAMGGPDLPTGERNFQRGETYLEPTTMRGHRIGTDPGILYNVERDSEITHPITGEHAIIATSIADPRFKS